MNQKGFVNILLIVIVVALAGATIYVVSTPTSKPSRTLKQSPTPSLFSDQDRSFETIAKLGYSGHGDRKNYVIKEISEWRSLWDIVNATMTPRPVLPDIDFGDEMIVAVFEGSHSTGGYDIEIVKILEKANSLEITVKETSPSPDSFVTQAFTEPFHIMKTKRSDKKIVFMR